MAFSVRSQKLLDILCLTESKSILWQSPGIPMTPCANACSNVMLLQSLEPVHPYSNQEFLSPKVSQKRTIPIPWSMRKVTLQMA